MITTVYVSPSVKVIAAAPDLRSFCITEITMWYDRVSRKGDIVDVKFDRVKFVRERDEALLSLEKEKIVFFCRKYGVYYPHSEIEFWKSVHKARVALKGIPEPDKEISREWLLQHGVRADSEA